MKVLGKYLCCFASQTSIVPSLQGTSCPRKVIVDVWDKCHMLSTCYDNLECVCLKDKKRKGLWGTRPIVSSPPTTFASNRSEWLQWGEFATYQRKNTTIYEMNKWKNSLFSRMLKHCHLHSLCIYHWLHRMRLHSM